MGPAAERAERLVEDEPVGDGEHLLVHRSGRELATAAEGLDRMSDPVNHSMRSVNEP